MTKELVNIIDLKKGDLFSFRTIETPIWWRFLEIKDGLIVYEGIRDNTYQFTTPRTYIKVLKKLKL